MTGGASVSCAFVAPGYSLADPRNAGKLIPIIASCGWDVTYIGPGQETDFGVERHLTRVLSLGGPRRSRFGRLRYLPQVLRYLIATKPDVILAVGLDAWICGVLYRSVRPTRLVVDWPEDYREMVEKWTTSPFWKGVLRRTTDAAMRGLAPHADLVISTRRQLLVRYKVGDRGVTFYNPTNANAVAVPTRRYRPPSPGELRLVHLGVMGAERGSHVLLDVLEGLPQNVEVTVTLIGRFYDDTRALLERGASRLNNVTLDIHDWLPYEQALALAAGHHLGLVLFQPWTENLRNAMPNKLFDYAAVGIPTLAPSWSSELATLVELAECGVLCDTSSPDSVIRTIGVFMDSRDDAVRLADNARRSVRAGGSLSFEVLAAELREALDQVV